MENVINEKIACKEYKHCCVINITLNDSHASKDYCVWFVAKNKKSCKKELNDAVESLKTKLEGLKESDKIDAYDLRSYSVDSHESIKKFKSAKFTVDNMMFILNEFKLGNMRVFYK